jgi:site-specific DNA-methyltransferase (adenine-specific)
MIELLNCDCMEYMKDVPDKYFDLAIVDPPYGIGEDKNKTVYGKAGKAGTFINRDARFKDKEWDATIPSPQYFIELKRVSKHQIIWGGNYFTEYLSPTKAWVFWYKKETNPNNKNFSDGELAWTSFKDITRMVSIDWIGFGYINSSEKKIHTSQKPVQLYKWLLKNYAKPDFKIIDTHLGSGSSAIAAYDFGCDFVGCEIDKDYYDAAVKRFEIHKMQQKLF